MTPEEQKIEREKREDKIKAAWKALATNKDFTTAFELDLHPRFSRPCFLEEDNFNPHAAAKRDGQRSVLVHIGRRLATAQNLDADESPKATEATIQFQGMTTPPAP